MNNFLRSTLFVVLVGAAALGLSQGQRRGGGQGMGDFALLAREDVRRDLALNADQKASLDKLQQESGMGGRGQAGRRRGNRGAGAATGGAAATTGGARPQMTEEERAARQKQREEQAKAFEGRVKGVLSETQVNRVRQIAIQLAKARAVLREDVQTALGLSAETITKAKELQSSAQKANAEVQQKARNQEIDRDDATAIIAKNAAALSTELMKLLTEGQAAKLKELGGAEFVADPRPQRATGG